MLRQLVHRLRTKIESDPANPSQIVNVPGSGYVLVETPAPWMSRVDGKL
jgi:DNA-binding response OmpR family regulator